MTAVLPKPAAVPVAVAAGAAVAPAEAPSAEAAGALARLAAATRTERYGAVGPGALLLRSGNHGANCDLWQRQKMAQAVPSRRSRPPYAANAQ